MPPRPQLTRNILATLVILAFGFALGVATVRYAITNQDDTNVPAAIAKLAPAQMTGVNTLKTVWDDLHTRYVNANVNDSLLVAGAISGMVNALNDPYTVFMNKDEAKTFQDEVSGSFEGVGLELGSKNNLLTVIAPLSGSPAEAAGIRPGDVILGIDGKDAQPYTIDQAVKAIRGPKGTMVTLLMQRGTETPAAKKLTRSTIVVASVKSAISTHSGKKIDDIQVTGFTTETDRLFRQEVQKGLDANVAGYVIDLRNNPGGYLDQAVKVASAIIPNGTIVSEVDRNGSKRNLSALGNPMLSGQRIVVLINGGSASASEIVAGALQDTKRATIIGEKSYGKGSVQEVVDLSDGSNLKMTIAKWFTPSGRSISELGIAPDQTVTLTQADATAGKDPQRDAAYTQLVKP